jgi:hypothetical protein
MISQPYVSLVAANKPCVWVDSEIGGTDGIYVDAEGVVLEMQVSLGPFSSFYSY